MPPDHRNLPTGFGVEPCRSCPSARITDEPRSPSACPCSEAGVIEDPEARLGSVARQYRQHLLGDCDQRGGVAPVRGRHQMVRRLVAERTPWRRTDAVLGSTFLHPSGSINPCMYQFGGPARSACVLARVYGERKRYFAGQSFSTRGYCVSTVGRDEQMIRT